MEPLALVMLIDRDENANQEGKHLLESMGFAKKVITMNSGHDAMEYINDQIADGLPCPDIVFIDINMPISGGVVFLYEYEQLAVEFSNCTKVVVTSVHKNQNNLEHLMLSEDIMAFIYKPYDQVSLERVHRTYQNYLR